MPRPTPHNRITIKERRENIHDEDKDITWFHKIALLNWQKNVMRHYSSSPQKVLL